MKIKLQGGQWMLELIDFGGTFLIFPLTTLQIVGFFWIYGLDNFCLDLEFMSKRKPSIYWRISWGVVTPTLMIILFIYSMINFEPPFYAGQEFPPAYLIMLWLLIAIGLLPLTLWVIHRVIKNLQLQENCAFHTKLINAVKQAFSPSNKWGPADNQLREDWLTHRKMNDEKRREYENNTHHSWFRRKLCILLGKY